MIGVELRVALVRRHVIVAEEQQAIAAGVLDHNLRVACIAYALFKQRFAPPVATTMPMLAPPVPLATKRPRPDNLRARLGIG